MPRNGSGTFTLVTGNPVVTGTTIESTWANNTLSDIATAMTDSLSRSGQGGMTAAFRAADGTASVPGIAWSSESGTGFYRSGSADTRLVITTTEVQKWLSTGTSVTGTFSVSGAATLNNFSSSSATLTGGTINGVAIGGSTPAAGAFTTLAASGNVTFDTDTLFVNATDNAVGIGTTSILTGEKLDVNGGVKGQSFNAVGTPAAFASAGGASLAYNGGGAAILRAYSNGSGGAGQLSLSSTGGLTEFVLNAAGNVGIGTSSPTFGSGSGLEIERAGIATFRLENSTASNSFELYADSAANGINLRGRDSSPMLFWTSNSERFRIGASGELGIGGANYGTSGQVLTSQGSGAAPQWTSAATGDVTLTGTQTLTNKTLVAPVALASSTATQDGIVVTGRAGGSSSYRATIQPATLTANRTVTIPDETFTVGFRNIPAVGTKTGSYSIAVGDVGKYVQVGTGGSITIPDATFAEGDVVSVFNNTSGNITITCSITTAYIAGTDSDKATMTLATRGVATILFISSTVCVVSGNVT